MFITESWFWRGTQSAIFYYISCSPYLESKHKRKRRKEAMRAEKERADIITTQPGLVMQPGPFQTNPDWAEEIIKGPGPPKGWKKEKILQGYTEKAREKYRNETQTPQPPAVDSILSRVDGANDSLPKDITPFVSNSSMPTVNFQDPVRAVAQLAIPPRSSSAEPMSPISESTSDTRPSTSGASHSEQPSKARPSMDRRLSSAVENLKGTIKGWNFKRYEREDEILSGLNERLTRIWDKATSYGAEAGVEGRKVSLTYGRKRARTNESDRYDYQRAVRNPEINELHPPTVSKLPATRDEAAWMLLPPPSAAVMAGRSRPQDEPALRWPLAQIDRNQIEWSQIQSTRRAGRDPLSRSTSSLDDSRKTPDLSNSSSDEHWSEEDEEQEARDRQLEGQKRPSASVEGWVPVIPKPNTQTLHSSQRHWARDEAPTAVSVW